MVLGEHRAVRAHQYRTERLGADPRRLGGEFHAAARIRQFGGLDHGVRLLDG
ncbi:hypothetical protein OV320_5159 [Actinobacteria bacterium OV320]|nr:hypothetical protein OV320_5159 [Actinobacteria bacterium OV320]